MLNDSYSPVSQDEMRAYDMEAVGMKRRGHYLSLEVPGLAERRPSLVTGDHIFAKCISMNPSTATSYQVHPVASFISIFFIYLMKLYFVYSF
jgi:hypothetical protein